MAKAVTKDAAATGGNPETALVAERETQAGGLAEMMPAGGSPALQIMLNERLFSQAKQIATYISKAEGFTPRHLIGQPEACFAVVTRSLTWKLDPFAVAQCTYQTPGGRIGYEGKLCQAILENSGQLVGPVKYDHYGDWSKVQGKFEIKKSQKDKDYAAQTWTQQDALGLGVTVSAQVKGEDERRTLDFDLIQAWPRNSTLWALDPRTQICYTAVRRFANVAAPGLFMGVPFDREDWTDDPPAPEHAKDITPARPTRATDQYRERLEAAKHGPEEPESELDEYTLVDEVGEAMGDFGPAEFADVFMEMFENRDGEARLQIVENNGPEIERLKDSPHAEGCYEPIRDLITGGEADAVANEHEAGGPGSAAEARPTAERSAAPDPAANGDPSKWKKAQWDKWVAAMTADIADFANERELHDWYMADVDPVVKTNANASRNEWTKVNDAYNNRLTELQEGGGG